MLAKACSIMRAKPCADCLRVEIHSDCVPIHVQTYPNMLKCLDEGGVGHLGRYTSEAVQRFFFEKNVKRAFSKQKKLYLSFKISNRRCDRGVFRGGGGQGRAPPPERFWEGASPPPPGFSESKRERALSLTTAIEKETKRKKVKEKEKYIVSGVMMAKEPSPLFPPSFISASPFLPFFL